MRQEPEKRGRLERAPARDERQVLGRGDTAADEMLAGLPRPPCSRRPEQRQERVEPFLAIESLVDRPGSGGPAPPSSSRPPWSSASSSGRSSRAARNGRSGSSRSGWTSAGIEIARGHAPGCVRRDRLQSTCSTTGTAGPSAARAARPRDASCPRSAGRTHGLRGGGSDRFRRYAFKNRYRSVRLLRSQK